MPLLPFILNPATLPHTTAIPDDMVKAVADRLQANASQAKAAIAGAAVLSGEEPGQVMLIAGYVMMRVSRPLQLLITTLGAVRPPGTGKTTTICNIAAKCVRSKPQEQILICAPSNAAGDDVAARLNRALPGLVLRVTCQNETSFVPGLCVDLQVAAAKTREIDPDPRPVNVIRDEKLRAASIIVTTLSGAARVRFLQLEKVIADENAATAIPSTLVALRFATKLILVGGECGAC